MAYALGIDLGTTFTAAATWQDGRADVVQLGSGRAVPSVVLVDVDGSFVVGDQADLRAPAEAERSAREFKRRFGDEIPMLLAGKGVTPEALTAQLLRWVIATVVRQRGGEQPLRVTLTVPATWLGYRQDLMQAVALESGLPAARTAFVPEPAAAAVFYAGTTQVSPGTTFGVYDFGGGTFDATVVRKTAGGFEILGLPMGIDDVGGIDIDHALQRRVGRSVGGPWLMLDVDDPAVRAGLLRLRSSVVEAKKALSRRTQTTVPVRLPGIDTEVSLSRRELEADAEPMVARTIELMRTVIAEAGLVPADLERILLVGGSSQMPLVATLLSDELGVTAVADTHPKYAVCLGAAIAAGALLAATSPADAPPEEATGRVPQMRPGPPAPPQQPPPPLLPGQPPEPAEEVTSIQVDLAGSGLTGAAQVPVRPAAELRRRRSPADNEALTASLGDGDRSRVVPMVVLAALVAAVLVVMVVLVAQ